MHSVIYGTDESVPYKAIKSNLTHDFVGAIHESPARKCLQYHGRFMNRPYGILLVNSSIN